MIKMKQDREPLVNNLEHNKVFFSKTRLRQSSKSKFSCLSFFFGSIAVIAILLIVLVIIRFEINLMSSFNFVIKGKKEKGFSFANYYKDHMVLQQFPHRANIWGWAPLNEINSQVTVTLMNSAYSSDKHIYKTVVKASPLSDRALWQVLLDPVADINSSFTLSATLGSKNIRISDILFGDVWICSGQSNMQFSISAMFNASTELKNAKTYPRIRLFTVSDTSADEPQFELVEDSDVWTLPNKETLENFAAVCWLYGKEIHLARNTPIGLISSCWGGTRIESWSSPDALKQCNFPNTMQFPMDFTKSEMKAIPAEKVINYFGTKVQDIPQTPYVLWNAMIFPLLNITIKGAIWYQGEANSVYRMDAYNCSIIALVEDWRSKFHTSSFEQTSLSFPFGIVQLGPKYKDTASTPVGFTDIRWHQTADIGFTPNSRLQNVFMATAFDTTDFESPYTGVHPRDKITPSHRLALAGLAVAYGQSSTRYRGPIPTSLKIDSIANMLTIEFDWSQNSDYAISVRAKYGFEICCSTDGKTGCALSGTEWREVDIVNHTDFTVTLSWKICINMFVTGIRYAWKETPCPYLACSIYGSTTNLPMTPFIYQGLITNTVVLN